MVPNTKGMTEQEIFEKVVRHLSGQGCKSKHQDFGHAYRGDNGLMCAVGCLLTDKEYCPSFEQRSVSSLAQDEVLPKRLLPHWSLLVSLQRIHDLFDPTEWATELRDIGENLNTDTVDRVDWSACRGA